MCHETVETDDHATLPQTATCMGCHANVKTDSPNIQKLKSFDDKNEPVPWRRVYRVPSFVYFSHKQHVSDAKVTCDVCHGNVPQMEQMQKVKDTSMAACIECHKSRSAPANCDTCHEVQ
jgi:Cytochrome c7 and related cytochrome c